jgi:hypothetical protein
MVNTQHDHLASRLRDAVSLVGSVPSLENADDKGVLAWVSASRSEVRFFPRLFSSNHFQPAACR